MLIQLFMGGNLKNAVMVLMLILPAILLCLAVHEMSHGLAAYALGDHTAKNAGRLTIDPFRHIDPMGFLCMLFLGFGWAKPIPVNIGNFKNKRLGMALTALAGPLSNMILAFVCFLAFLPLSQQSHTFPVVASLFFYYTAQLSVGLGVFNLIPIHPFDGSRILGALLPFKTEQKLTRFVRRYQAPILLAVILIVWYGGLSLIISFFSDGLLWLALKIMGPFL